MNKRYRVIDIYSLGSTSFLEDELNSYPDYSLKEIVSIAPSNKVYPDHNQPNTSRVWAILEHRNWQFKTDLDEVLK